MDLQKFLTFQLLKQEEKFSKREEEEEEDNQNEKNQYKSTVYEKK